MVHFALKVLAVLALAQGLDASHKLVPSSYDGQQVVQVLGADTPQKMLSVYGTVHEVLIPRFVDGGLTARVSADQVTVLEYLGFQIKVLVEDYAKTLAAQMAEEQPAISYRHSDVAEEDDRFTAFHDLASIEDYLDDLVAMNVTNGVKQSWLKKKEIGKTVENRPIYAVEIGNPAAPNAIYMGANIHAREWVAHTSAQYVLREWIHLYADGTDPELFNTYKFFFVPMLNADGFHYSWVTDRTWRKNRAVNTNDSCPGVDLNRNFNGFNGWKLEPDQCSNNYGGPKPYSEAETNVVVKYMAAIKKKHRIVAAFDMHCRGQYLLYPYGYDFELPDAPNRKAHEACGWAMSHAMKAETGKYYKVWNAADWYPGYGCQDDYWYDKVVRGPWANDTGLVYTIEMRPKEGDPIGFVLPADQILPAGKELFAGWKAAITFIDAKIRPK